MAAKSSPIPASSREDGPGQSHRLLRIADDQVGGRTERAGGEDDVDVAGPRAELGRGPGDPGREGPVVARPDGRRHPGEQVAGVAPSLLGCGEQYRKRGEQRRPRLGHVLIDGLDHAERHSRSRSCQRVAPRHLRGEPDQPATGDDVHPVDPVPHQPADGERQFLVRPAGCARIEGLFERRLDRGPVVVEPVEPGDLPGPAVAGRRRHPVDHPAGSGPDHRLLLTGLAQHAPRVCPDGVELAEPGRTTGPGRPCGGEERPVGQAADEVERRSGTKGWDPADGLGGIERERPGEYGEPAVRDPLVGGGEAVAPVDLLVQVPLPGRTAAQPGQRARFAAQPVGDLVEGERSHPGRGELDPER